MTVITGGSRLKHHLAAAARRSGVLRGRSGEDAAPVFRRLLEQVATDRLGDRAAPRVVIVSDRDDDEVERWVAELLPDAVVRRLAPGAEVVPAIAAAGRPDLIIDEGEDGRRVQRLAGHLMLLAPGGVAAARLPRPGRRRVNVSAERKAAAALGAAAAQGAFDRASGGGPAPAQEHDYLARAAADFSAVGGHLVVVRRAVDDPVAVKVREEWSEQLVAARRIGKVATVSPPTTFESRGTVSVSESDHRGPYPDRWDVPAMLLRTYDDVVSAPRQIVHRGDLVLPESFRHAPQRSMGHETLPAIARDFSDPTVRSVYTEPTDEPPRELEGTYFHLDNEFRGHFGHLLTESIARLWAWEKSKAEHPDLKVLLHPNSRELSEYELSIYEAAGVAREDVVLVPHAVRVERLVGATQMFCNPHYVHPGIEEVWRRVGDRLAAQAGEAERPRRIFIGRRIAKRPCRNADEVEAFFTGLGFTTVYPEDHSLGEQVRLFRDAEEIAGYAGSGLFTAMFVRDPKTMYILTSESYTGENEILIGGVMGHDIHVGFARSEGTRRGERWAPGSYHAPFRFDPAREGEFFREAVAGRRR